MRPVRTDEQQAIIESPAKTLVVQAFAGTGKTTTLVDYAAARPESKILYVAYNKAIQQEAERKFGANVTCRTTHALAYRAQKIFDLPRDKLGNVRVFDVIEQLGIKNPGMARAALSTVENYMCSADAALTEDHIPLDAIERFAPGPILTGATKLWAAMLNTSVLAIKMPHDAYLKAWQLAGASMPGYDIVLFDECQDANPVTTAVMLAQPGRKVLVGDHHQSIYGFRGAKDAVRSVVADQRLALSRSFRFGSGIAKVANRLLSYHKGERVPIVGAGAHPSAFELDESRQVAVLARTNARLFDEAARLIGRQRLHWVGGPDSYRMELILDTHRVMTNQRGSIADAGMRRFSSINEMEDFANQADDVELLVLAKIGKEHGASIPDLVTEIRAQHAVDLAQADAVLTTAHRAKGLEFDQVRLTDDFQEFYSREHKRLYQPGELDDQEVNLVYVAATRARQNLKVNPRLAEFLSHTDSPEAGIRQRHVAKP